MDLLNQTLNSFSIQISNNSGGEVSVKSREENRIELVSKTETGGLLVLSEIVFLNPEIVLLEQSQIMLCVDLIQRLS